MNLKRENSVELNELLLKEIQSGDVEAYIKEHCFDEEVNFPDFFTDFVHENEIAIPTVIERSNVSKNYIYNILNKVRKPSRDKVIALCIGAGMKLDEINEALEVAREATFNPKDERDVRIMAAIKSGVRTVDEINLMLDKKSISLIK